MALLDDKGLKYFVGKLKDMFAPKSHTHDDRYYTESEVNTKLNGKSNTGHTHDDRYYTESEVDSKLAGKANSSHTHTKAQVGLGNVDNTADSAKSVKAATKLQTYKQGSTTETYGDSYPLYAQWSGNDVVLKCDNYKVNVNYADNAGTANEINPNNSYGSITKAVRPMFDSVRANRLAFLPSDQIIIEKTVDGGKTWTDAGITDYNKRALFSENGGGFTLPQIDGKKNTLCGIRLTITGMKYNVPAGTAETAKYNYWNSKYVKNTERYCTIGDMFFWVSGGSDDISLVIERATGAASTSWANLFTSSSSTGHLNGWSGPNYIKFSEGTLGGGTGQTSNWWNYRFTFMSHPGNGSAFNSNYITQAQNVTMIKAYGASVWNASNNLMSNDHMYGWDVDKNVTFPAKVTATGFNGVAAKLAQGGDLSKAMTFNWSGKNGQPTWLWGGEDGNSMYVYSPSNFNVNSAKTAASADSAKKLTTNAGSATQPVYFANGVPVAITYTLGKSVPANAVFTDTNTWRGVQNNLTSDSTDQSLSAAQGKVLKSLVDGKAASGHTHTKSQITDFPSSLPASDVYAWAKAGTKPSYTKSEVGLGNVDNTADSAKSVKYATSAGSAGSATKATGVVDYGATGKTIQIGYGGDGISGDNIKYIAGYTTGDGSTVTAKIKDVSKDDLKSWIGLGSAAYTATSAFAAASHTHPYAGAASSGGSATSAVKLDTTTAGSATQPVYFTGGKPAACTYTLGKSVPSNAVFTDTTYGDATTSAHGLMTAADKSKLNGIAAGANKTVVDSTISQSSTNPVQNRVITKRLQYLYSFKISRDKWNEASDKSNWNVIVSWTNSSGTALTGSTTGTPNLTTDMSLGPAMMERTSSLSDNIILSGELSMINQGQIFVCETNKLSFTVKRRPVCDLMLYFYARQWTT